MACAENAEPLSKQSFQIQNQLGVINRSTRQLLDCNDYNSLIAIVEAVVHNLNLSGFIQLSGVEFRCIRKLNKGLTKSSAKSLATLMLESSKIAIDETLMVFKWADFVLVIDTHALPSVEASQLQDTLAIFLDSVQSWLSKHRAIELTKQQIREKLVCFKRNLNDGKQFLDNHREQLTSKMLSDIAVLLPILDLEPAQEDQILNAINPVIDNMQTNISNQSTVSDDFITIIDQLISFLDHTASPAPNEHIEEFNETDNIVLF